MLGHIFVGTWGFFVSFVFGGGSTELYKKFSLPQNTRKCPFTNSLPQKYICASLHCINCLKNIICIFALIISYNAIGPGLLSIYFTLRRNITLYFLVFFTLKAKLNGVKFLVLYVST